MKSLVVKDNALVNASYDLDLVEQRLVLLAIVEARESGKGINANDPLVIHAESYINQFKVHRNTAYQALKDACKCLFARQFSYQEEKDNGTVRNVTSRWVSQIAYNDNEASVDLIFAPAVVPFITRLEERFTKYELEQVSNLKSAYSIRLYELLIQWRSIGRTPVIRLDEFRKKVGVLDNEETAPVLPQEDFNIMETVEQETEKSQEEMDLQKELEAKFDELFGPIDDEE